MGRLIGYGYEPFRAIKIGVVIIAIGAIVFAIGASRNLMAETKLAEAVLSREGELGTVSPTYPRFNALVWWMFLHHSMGGRALQTEADMVRFLIDCYRWSYFLHFAGAAHLMPLLGPIAGSPPPP